jgi:hypothetical protein
MRRLRRRLWHGWATACALSAWANQFRVAAAAARERFRSVGCRIRRLRATRPPLQGRFTRRFVLETQVDAPPHSRQRQGDDDSSRGLEEAMERIDPGRHLNGDEHDDGERDARITPAAKRTVSYCSLGLGRPIISAIAMG